MTYTIERQSRMTDVDSYIKSYIDIPRFLKYCMECPNYNKVWSCPQYDFDPLEIWQKYKYLDIIQVKIIYDDELRATLNDKNEIIKTGIESIKAEKNKLIKEFSIIEEQNPRSKSLWAGSCDLCGGQCSKENNEPCRHPGKMRYSIEALGGDVEKTVKDFFDTELKWSDGSSLAEYHILLCGLLRN